MLQQLKELLVDTITLSSLNSSAGKFWPWRTYSSSFLCLEIKSLRSQQTKLPFMNSAQSMAVRQEERRSQEMTSPFRISKEE